jgi:GAF domain-containing protein
LHLSEKSTVYATLGGDHRGLINLSDFAREHAFSESDVRLLSTLANSMSVALENARLFDETQRLFKAEQRRAAELAVINSIQQGLAAELNFQAIVDLVGDKLREVLHTGEIGIRWYDAQADLVHFLYEYEHGARLTIPSRPPTEAWLEMAATRQPRVVNTLAESLRVGLLPGTDQSLSSVAVPIVGSDRVVAPSSSRTTRRNTPSAIPTCACCKQLRPPWAWPSRTRVSSTRPSACSR